MNPSVENGIKILSALWRTQKENPHALNECVGEGIEEYRRQVKEAVANLLMMILGGGPNGIANFMECCALLVHKQIEEDDEATTAPIAIADVAGCVTAAIENGKSEGSVLAELFDQAMKAVEYPEERSKGAILGTPRVFLN